MRSILPRASLYALLVSTLICIGGVRAQEADSLDKVIGRIQEKGFTSQWHRKETSASDSVSIIEYLAEGSRLSSVNSDSSLVHIIKAFRLAYRAQSPALVSLAAQDLGGYYLSHELYRQAVTCYLACLRIEENRNDNKRMAGLYNALGSVYYYLEVFDKSLDYHQKALELFRSNRDTSGIAVSLNYLGQLHSSREFCEKRNEEEKLSDFKTAISFFEKSLLQYQIAGNENGIASCNQDIASVYNKMKKPEVALGYVQKSLEYFRKINDPEGIAGALYTLGKTYYRLKEYDKSIQAYKESEKIGLESNLTGGIQYLYEAMAMPYYDKKDYKSAYDYYIRYMTLRDSVYNADKTKQIIELETKYQSQVKENEILRLNAREKRGKNLLILLSALIIMLGSSIYYYIRLLRKNKIIARQNIEIREKKIAELEKEKLYLAARSVMEGEEAERSRLASDLHDGLGGLLSGIKINLSSMKENAVITHDNVNAFNHAISLLDTSISELRRIAHNLMPETLNHFGLRTALEDFCSQVAPAGKPVIIRQFFGDDIRYTREIELTMYRVIQELVNNAINHSGAGQIRIQHFSEPERLSAQVTDNGKGFEKDSGLRETAGKGLQNISDRITALNGRFDIWSKTGEGTEISVELSIS